MHYIIFSIFKLCLLRLHPKCTCVKLTMYLGVLDVVDCVVRIIASLVENATKHTIKLVAYVILGVAHATSQNGRLHSLELHM